ncbi:DUF1707 domain-containing protein [Nocardioides sp. CN2-186]|uniref:DUF1707 SHOCT-like domain-containing protein n=1 Tax=Nocardioides tweenelious TaxID=3156607 RepID=UPI0032B5F016
MSTPDQRARDKDRDAAIEVVEAAWADGQIVEADRDKRVEELLRAQTLGEITMLTHDLQADSAPAAPAPPAPPYSAPSAMPDVPVAAARTGKPSRAMLVVPLVVVALTIAGIGAGIAVVVSAVGDSVDVGGGPSGQTYAPGVEPEGDDVNVLSEQGYADLVAAIESANGSDQAFSAVLYPTYAVLDLPVDATSHRESSWYWNGDLEEEDGMTGTSSDERFALRSVDPAVVVRLVKQVRGEVEDPTTWYAVVGAPREDRSMIWAYASNDYDETVYLGARRNGTITYDSTEH